MTAKEKAFSLIQTVGLIPIEFDGSTTLPFDMAKSGAITWAKEISANSQNGDYWEEVIEEIKNYTI